MNEPKPNITELPYAPWLEGALQELVGFPVKGICMFAVTPDGAVYSNYHDISVMDKLTISGLIQMDATTESLIANGQIKPLEEVEG
jgi:hypothetical protein